jgi:hypothetical protein
MEAAQSFFRVLTADNETKYNIVPRQQSGNKQFGCVDVAE